MASLVTPNLDEAAILAEMPVRTEHEMREAARRLGVERIDDLFAAIPESHRLSRDLDLEPARTGLAPAEMGLESRSAGGLAPKHGDSPMTAE